MVLEPFDYTGVTLRPSLWQRQRAAAGRDSPLLGFQGDDILHGYPRRLPGPLMRLGVPLGGWCSPNSNTVFGQWLQSMARMQRSHWR